MNLSQEQQTIINTSGNIVVKASAGTGKTFILTTKINRDLENNSSHKVFAAVTFTIKATQELKDRLHILSSSHQPFIGTINNFALEEVIKPFIQDAFGDRFNLENIETNYSKKIADFTNGLEEIATNHIICSYDLKSNKNNFIFELALQIIKKSKACRLFLQSKYNHIYIDEYQDCDKSMHNFFMYLCDKLKINTFIVGDYKQSIYTWRGSNPNLFKEICEKANFTCLTLSNNYRSSIQIQNYSNILYAETCFLYKEQEINDNVIAITSNTFDWHKKVLQYIDENKNCTILRYRRQDAEHCATLLTKNSGINFTYIVQPPISDIVNNNFWVYQIIAKYIILNNISGYDIIYGLRNPDLASRIQSTTLNNLLSNIKSNLNERDEFHKAVESIFKEIDLISNNRDIDLLFNTVTNDNYRPYFEQSLYKNTSMTFHSSKGLEFDQVILFATDFPLNTPDSICNHYVAATRARHKLILIMLNQDESYRYLSTIKEIYRLRNINIKKVINFID